MALSKKNMHRGIVYQNIIPMFAYTKHIKTLKKYNYVSD